MIWWIAFILEKTFWIFFRICFKILEFTEKSFLKLFENFDFEIVLFQFFFGFIFFFSSDLLLKISLLQCTISIANAYTIQFSRGSLFARFPTIRVGFELFKTPLLPITIRSSNPKCESSSFGQFFSSKRINSNCLWAHKRQSRRRQLIRFGHQQFWLGLKQFACDSKLKQCNSISTFPEQSSSFLPGQ